MRPHYEIMLTRNNAGLWQARRNIPTTSPALIGTGTTLRDALDELALQLERERREHDNAPH